MSDSPISPEEFEAAFQDALPRLRQAVLAACPQGGEWPERVAAGIYAAVDFAEDEPAAICVLTRDALLHRPDGPGLYLALVESFAELLRQQAPREPKLPPNTAQALVGAIAITINDHLATGSLNRLAEAAPELVELSLQPYLGREQARRVAQRPGPGRRA